MFTALPPVVEFFRSASVISIAMSALFAMAKMALSIRANWETTFAQLRVVVVGPCVRRGDGDLRAKTLRRAGDRRAAAARHLHHGQPALIGTVGAETEQAVDAG